MNTGKRPADTGSRENATAAADCPESVNPVAGDRRYRHKGCCA